MSTVNSRVRRSSVLAVGSAALAATLSACAMSDDSMARFVDAPDKYLLYSCDEIAKEAQVKGAREQELRQLMAKAGTDAGGRLVSGLAYDADYLTVRGENNELRAAAGAKHCDSVPGAASPAARANDRVIR
jgi:hypothetical protein